MNFRSALFAAILGSVLLASGPTLAQVSIKDAWVRATVAQQKATGAFMQITAPKDTRLVAARSNTIPVVELHEMALQDDVMRMRQIAGLDLPANQTVALRPGGHHLMLLNLPHALQPGDTVPLTLEFEDKTGRRETVSVQAAVRALSTKAPAAISKH